MSEKPRKWKLIKEKATVLKRKKSLLTGTISELDNVDDRLAYEAENSNDLESMKSLLAKSNSFCTTAERKGDKLQEYGHRLNELNKKKELLLEVHSLCLFCLLNKK